MTFLELDTASFENLKDTDYYVDAEYAKFSDAEFKRRYSLTREAMKQRNLDCLIVLGGSDLTSFGGGLQWLSGLFDRRNMCQYLIAGGAVATATWESKSKAKAT